MTHASTWINLEDIMISDSGQEQKDKRCMSPLMSSWSHQIKIEWSGGPGQEEARAVSKGLQSGVTLCKRMAAAAQ